MTHFLSSVATYVLQDIHFKPYIQKGIKFGSRCLRCENMAAQNINGLVFERARINWTQPVNARTTPLMLTGIVCYFIFNGSPFLIYIQMKIYTFH